MRNYFLGETFIYGKHTFPYSSFLVHVQAPGGLHPMSCGVGFNLQALLPGEAPNLSLPGRSHLCRATLGTERPSPSHLDDGFHGFGLSCASQYTWCPSALSWTQISIPSLSEGVSGYLTKPWLRVHGQREETDPVSDSKLNSTWFFKLSKGQKSWKGSSHPLALLLTFSPHLGSTIWWRLNLGTSESKISNY